MFGLTGIWFYLFIFVAKVIEVALSTLRVIILNSGKKMLGAILLFIIIIIWLIVAGMVVINITEDPISIIMYALGNAVGSYLGSWLEEKLALGDNIVMAIIDDEKGDNLTNILRKKGYAVTTMDGKGLEKNKKVLMIASKRKKRQDIIKVIKKIDKQAMILVQPALDIHGGYVK
jgi:uncharacterized protein YebE (UPF0316 family)